MTSVHPAAKTQEKSCRLLDVPQGSVLDCVGRPEAQWVAGPACSPQRNPGRGCCGHVRKGDWRGLDSRLHSEKGTERWQSCAAQPGQQPLKNAARKSKKSWEFVAPL